MCMCVCMYVYVRVCVYVYVRVYCVCMYITDWDRILINLIRLGDNHSIVDLQLPTFEWKKFRI